MILTLGEKIRAARLARKLTQEQLAGHEFTKSYVSELERGTRTPRVTTLRVLARRLNRPLSYFLDGVPEEQESEAFLGIGLVYLHAGARMEAQAAFERALELAAQQEDETLEARIELALAALEHDLGQTGQAWRRINRAIHVLSHTDDRTLLARAQTTLGLLRLDGRDPSSAIWAFEAALRMAAELPQDPALLADLHVGLAEAHLQLGRTDDAERAYRAALAAVEPFRDPSRVAARHLAVAAAAGGRFEEAVEHAGKALAVHHVVGYKRRLADIHQALGEADAAGGRWEAAEAHYRWSLALQSAVANWPGAAGVLGEMAESMLTRSLPEGARSVGETALALLAPDEVPQDQGHSLRVRGVINRLLNRPDDARAALEESLQVFETAGRYRDARLVRQELVLLAIETRDIEAAKRHLKALEQPRPRRSAGDL
ncbi:MAG TPA: helix-turn-helix transcriptional regulator [bacterium]|nr:helix-turn-helix transcriptional regulator [bacterium]